MYVVCAKVCCYCAGAAADGWRLMAHGKWTNGMGEWCVVQFLPARKRRKARKTVEISLELFVDNILTLCLLGCAFLKCCALFDFSLFSFFLILRALFFGFGAVYRVFCSHLHYPHLTTGGFFHLFSTMQYATTTIAPYSTGYSQRETPDHRTSHTDRPNNGDRKLCVCVVDLAILFRSKWVIFCSLSLSLFLPLFRSDRLVE